MSEETANYWKDKKYENWLSENVKNISFNKLDTESINIFKEGAIKSNRLSKEVLHLSNGELLRRLDLSNRYDINRAGILLFHRKPHEILNSKCYVKIEKYEGGKLIYQDTVYGSIMLQVERTVDLIYLKYLKASIINENDSKSAKYPYPIIAVQEAFYNALLHSDWSSNNPIKIKVGEGYLSITNSVKLDRYCTDAEDYIRSRNAVPQNPVLTNVLWRSGYINNWQEGVDKIDRHCQSHGCETPRYIIDKDGITIIFRSKILYPEHSWERALEYVDKRYNNCTLREPGSEYICVKESGIPAGIRMSARERRESILEIIDKKAEVTAVQLAEILGVTSRTIERDMQQLKSEGRLIRIGSDIAGHWELN